MNQLYYIVSIKWTGGGQYRELVTFWCPKFSGYTIVLSRAGKYTREQLRGDIPIGDTGRKDADRSFAVPIEMVDLMSMPVVENTNRHMKMICEWRSNTDA